MIINNAFISIAYPVHAQCKCQWCCLYDIKAFGMSNAQNLNAWREPGSPDPNDWEHYYFETPLLIICKSTDLENLVKFDDDRVTICATHGQWAIGFVRTGIPMPDLLLHQLPFVYFGGENGDELQSLVRIGDMSKLTYDDCDIRFEFGKHGVTYKTKTRNAVDWSAVFTQV